MALFNPVADLKPFKTMWRVRVSIVRLWKQYSVAGGLTIEMVVIDPNGDKIHASVKKELVNQFDQLLEQGRTITLTNFSVNHSVDLPGRLNGFTPVGFRQVLDGSLNPDFLIDLIGHVVEVSHVEMISVNGKDTIIKRYKLHLVVFDNTGTSKFILFDHLARKLLNQPCIELTGPLAEKDPYLLPLALLNLIGKTYLFKIEILRENFIYKHDTFKVNKIMTDLDVISEFVSPNPLKGSLMLMSEGSSQQRDPSDLTPAKRRGGPDVNLDEEPYLNSVTKSGITTRIKKEKHDKSG
ncbi:uncharacterized protein LOC130498050 [Raphanus sativus]|uniref:Uncharacterized protein LOC130498050 n=1 Tax=Raphanus sativus TaxID=3726 RepID=A0A9W3C7C5_RAPSA|nr:uncharacterized protein LOC130498050 [Raphanus sativus]